MGNKEKLIKKGLIDLFPKKINVFLDLFGGSGVVSMNCKANKYLINDKYNKLFDFYNMFKTKKYQEIVNHIENQIKNFQLESGIHKQGWSKKHPNEEYPKDLQNKIKFKYNEFRNHYNKNKDIMDLYILMIFCNSHNIRFNSNGEFNMSIGNSGFCMHHIEEIQNTCDFFSKDFVNITNCDFRDIDLNLLKNTDFVYIDPPYSNTLAIYNEQQGWSINDDRNLFEICEELNKREIKWGLSNVFENKGIFNKHLIEWCENNKWNIYEFNGHKYTSCGKGNSKSKEVYICNY